MRLITLRETAKLLRVSVSTLQAIAAQPGFPAVRLRGSRRVLVDADRLEFWLLDPANQR